MICYDENLKLASSNDKLYVVRKNSMLSYTLDSLAESVQSKPELIMTSYQGIFEYSGLAYSYDGTSIHSFESSLVRKCLLGHVFAFYRYDSLFYFIKNHLNKLSLIDESNTELFTFSGPYIFYDSSLFCIVDGSLTEFVLSTSECRTILHGLPPNISHFNLLRCDDQLAVVLADSHNTLHLSLSQPCAAYHDNKTHSYAYHDNKILRIILTDCFIFSVSASGTVSRLGLYSESRTVLFRFMGRFVDFVRHGTRLYLLSSVYFIIYDLASDTVVLSLPLPGFGTLSPVVLVPDSDTSLDLFKLKRNSTTVIGNSLECANNSLACAVGIIRDNLLFFADSSIFAQFVLPGTQNFISGEFVISVIRTGKKRMETRVYKASANKLVLYRTEQVERHPLNSIYCCLDMIYYRAGTSLYTSNAIGMMNELVSGVESVVCTGNELLVCLPKGVYDITSANYRLKQNKIEMFVIYNGIIVYSVESRVYYKWDDKPCDSGITEPYDLLIYEEYLWILHGAGGKQFILKCKLENGKLVVISKEQLPTACSRIVQPRVLQTSKNQVILLK